MRSLLKWFKKDKPQDNVEEDEYPCGARHMVYYRRRFRLKPTSKQMTLLALKTGVNLNKNIRSLAKSGFDNLEFPLRKGYKIKALNKYRQTAIHLSFYSFRRRIYKIDSIFFQCEKDKNYTDLFGLSHLHIACAVNAIEAVRHFAEKEENVNARCFPENKFKNYTPLLFAVRFMNEEIIEYLLGKGADVNAADASGMTAIHMACTPAFLHRYLSRSWKGSRRSLSDDEEKLENDGLRVMNLLIKHGANVNAADKSGNTPLLYIFESDADYYIENESDEDFIADRHSHRKLRLIQLKKLKVLIQNNADATAMNAKGHTALHLAIELLKPFHCSDPRGGLSRYTVHFYFDDAVISEMISEILKAGFDVNSKIATNERPLQKAVTLLSAEVVKVLLEYGANAYDVKFDSQSLKFCYCPELLPRLEVVENLLDIVEMLKEYGRHFNLKDQLTILKFLIHHGCDFKFKKRRRLRDLDIAWNHLYYGSVTHIEHLFNSIPPDNDYIDYICECYLSKREVVKFWVDDKIRAKIEKCGSSSESSLHSEEHIEMEILKKTVLPIGISLFDILRMHPSDVYQYLISKEYRKIFRTYNFNTILYHFSDPLSGQITKALIRKYIVDTAMDLLKFVLRLPDLCCEKLLSYMTNEEIYNLYAAAACTDE